jgi:hypothetical protein
VGRVWPRRGHCGPPLNSVVRTHPIGETPRQVRRALFLLWTAFILLVIESVAEIFAVDSLEFGLAEPVGWVLLFVANAVVIRYAAQRRRWARMVLLLFTSLSVVGVGAYVAFPEFAQDERWWSIAADMVITGMEVVALFWLFTGPSRAWYSRAVNA